MRQVYAARGLAGWSEFMADEISNARVSTAPPGSNAGSSSTAIPRAILYGAAGRFRQAFASLDEAIAIRDPALVYLAVGPQWDPLRADPRFATRLQALSLPAVER
jgi:hypothetical protein